MMLRLQDTLFNWLQITVVSKARPDDQAAKKTADFFYTMLTEDHSLENVEIDPPGDNAFYTVRYSVDGEARSNRYDREVVEQLLNDIEAEPRYNL